MAVSPPAAICGVICEYNPFHKGHAYHLQRARELTGAQAVVCVMSGPFTQRGDAALFSPRLRARMALLGGADAVVELPCAFSAREAEFFALGGVSILQALGATHIAFGCEHADLAALSRAALLLEKPTGAFSALLRRGLDAGQSHPRAQGAALSALVPEADGALVSSPNNVLAICYLRALYRLKSGLIPVPIPRLGGYHDTGWREGFASATAIRAALGRGDWAFVERAVPKAALPTLQAEIEAGRFHKPRALDMVLRDRLRTLSGEELSGYPNVGEGLENRLLNLAPLHTSRASLLDALKTKRYTYARLNRLLTHILLGMTRQRLANCQPSSFRLLGFGPAAGPFLGGLPKGLLYTRPARQPRDTSLMLDMAAYDLWAMGAGLSLDEGYRQQVVKV